jgi:hypothetical protein
MCEAGVNAPSCQMPGRDARSRDAEMAVAEMGGMLCDWPWGRSLDNSPKTYLNRHLAIMLLSIDVRRSFLNLEELRLFAETVILLVDRSRVLRLTIDIPRPLVLASQLGLVSRRRSSHLTCTLESALITIAAPIPYPVPGCAFTSSLFRLPSLVLFPLAFP